MLTPERITEIHNDHGAFGFDHIAFARALEAEVRWDERERCAKLAESNYYDDPEIAKAIRALEDV